MASKVVFIIILIFGAIVVGKIIYDIIKDFININKSDEESESINEDEVPDSVPDNSKTHTDNEIAIDVDDDTIQCDDCGE